MANDYYKILGVSDEEKNLKGDDFKKTLKSKYKKLCKEWHPDLERDETKKKEKEAKFKEIAEAYEVLSDDKKRAEYDNPISGGANFHFDGFSGGFNMHDIFSQFGFGDMFGGFGGGKQTSRNPLNGTDKKIKINVTLEEIFNGTSKKVKYTIKDKCPHCNGSGNGDGGAKVEKCPHCNGSGFTTVNTPFGQMTTSCQHCGGSGHINKNKCKHCGGSGLIDKQVEYELQIPKGVVNGSILTVYGEGNYPKNPKGARGNLQVMVAELPHEKFARDGENIYVNIDVPILKAIMGGNIDVETIDGKKITTKLPQGVDEGVKLRFGGKGMPIYGHENVRGNMIGIVNHVMPKSLTKEEIDILSQLKDKPNFK